MGHVRLGYLPKTRRWSAVVELIASSPDDIGILSDATARAAEKRLRELRNDASFAYCFWLLTRIASASRAGDFAGALSEFGIELRPDETALSFISQVSRQAGRELAKHPESGPFSELASLSMRRALTETVGQQSQFLFDSPTRALCVEVDGQVV